MKKAITLILAFTMIFACTLFTGCSSSTTKAGTTDAVTSTNSAESPSETTLQDAAKAEGDKIVDKVANDVQARLDAGKEVFIGYSVNTLSNPFLKLTVDYINQKFTEMGVTVSIMACEGDTALMISQMENFIEMGVDMIICAPLDQIAVEGVCVKAMEAGIPVVFNGQYPAYYEKLAGGAAVDYAELGNQVALMSSKWIDKNYPNAGKGEIHAAVLGFNNTYIFKLLYNQMLATIANDPRVTISYTGEAHNSIDLGYNAAEEAMTMDPDIRLFMVFQEGPAIGVNNYLTSQPGYDLSKFAIFAGSYSVTSAELLKAAADNKSVLRGSCNYGTYGRPADKKVAMAEGLYQVSKGVLLGTAKTPFWVLDDIWTMDTIGYDKVIDNPENDFLK